MFKALREQCLDRVGDPVDPHQVAQLPVVSVRVGPGFELRLKLQMWGKWKGDGGTFTECVKVLFFESSPNGLPQGGAYHVEPPRAVGAAGGEANISLICCLKCGSKLSHRLCNFLP